VLRQVETIRTPARRLSPGKISLLANAVVAACDGRDGATDGLVSDPERCAFDPGVLACKGGDGPDCLTAPQIETVNRAYSTVRTNDGKPVYPGSAVGFEAGLRMPDAPLELHYSPFRYIGRQDANWDPMSFDLETDLALTLKHGGVIEANDPNLAAFKARGGKLLLYHGWADPGPAPANTIAYLNAVGQTLGGSQESWLRLFLMPGVGHCGGGRGPDRADFIGALDRWRESGVAGYDPPALPVPPDCTLYGYRPHRRRGELRLHVELSGGPAHLSDACSADLWGEPCRLASRTRGVRATEVKSALRGGWHVSTARV
jgi:feruloyl esterase